VRQDGSILQVSRRHRKEVLRLTGRTVPASGTKIFSSATKVDVNIHAISAAFRARMNRR
jgi:hypothetical protein